MSLPARVFPRRYQDDNVEQPRAAWWDWPVELERIALQQAPS